MKCIIDVTLGEDAHKFTSEEIWKVVFKTLSKIDFSSGMANFPEDITFINLNDFCNGK